MTENDLLLTIDQGGHATRALLFNYHGRIMGEGLVDIETYKPFKNWVEHDPEEVLSSVERAIKKAVNAIRMDDKKIVAAALMTQRSSIVCWDNKSGRPLSPIISWQDRRAASWINKFSQYGSIIHQTTGLFPTAHYGASKFRWCMDNLPPVKIAYENDHLSWGPISSFLMFRLLKQRPLITDPANASRTLLWNFQTMDWDETLLNLFSLPKKPLPRCVPTRFYFGDLYVSGRPVPLQIATGDQSAALFANGEPESEYVYINIGTGAFVQRPFRNEIGFSSKLLTSVVLQYDNMATYVLEGTVNGAGSAFSKIEKELGFDPGEAQQRLSDWMETAISPPLFLNGVSGLGSPFWVPDFQSEFIGEGEIWEKFVGVAESILFLLQINMIEMQKYLPQPTKILISGGWSNHNPLCQRLADLSGVSVYRPVEHEATSRGAAYLLAGRPKFWPETATGSWFNPRSEPELKTRFQRWLTFMEKAIEIPYKGDI